MNYLAAWRATLTLFGFFAGVTLLVGTIFYFPRVFMIIFAIATLAACWMCFYFRFADDGGSNRKTHWT